MKGPDVAGSPFDARLRASLLAVAMSGAAATLGAVMLADMRAALSTAAGASVATANLWALARIVTALLQDKKEGSSFARGGGIAVWATLALLKMSGLLLVVWMLLRFAVVSPLPMLIGFGALPMGIAIGSLIGDRRLRF